MTPTDHLTPELESLLDDPRRAADVRLDAVPALLDALAVQEGRLGVVKAVLTARLVTPPSRIGISTAPFTLSEAAALLHKSPAWVRRHAKDGRIPCARKIGKSWVFPRVEFTRFCDRRHIG